MNRSISQLNSIQFPAWLDLLSFKLCWIALVVFQSEAIVAVLMIIALKIITWRDIPRFMPVICLILLSGLVMDSILTAFEVFVFPSFQSFPSSFIPPWLMVLWLSFALTLPRGFAFVGRWHLLAQAGIGVLAGCAGYFAGYLLNAVSFGFSLQFTAALIAILWAMFVPAMFMLNNHFQRKNNRKSLQ